MAAIPIAAFQPQAAARRNADPCVCDHAAIHCIDRTHSQNIVLLASHSQRRRCVLHLTLDYRLEPDAYPSSQANILVLNLMHGKELGWVCLGSCGADVRFLQIRTRIATDITLLKVICNSVAIFWVTDRGVTPPTAAAAIRKVPVTLGIRRSLDSGMSPNMQMNNHSPETDAINDRGAYFDHSTGSGPSRSNYSGDVPRVAYPGIRDHRPRLPSWFSSAHSDKPDTPEDMEVRVLSLFFL